MWPERYQSREFTFRFSGMLSMAWKPLITLEIDMPSTVEALLCATLQGRSMGPMLARRIRTKVRACGLGIPGSHLPLLVVGSVTLRGRDSATLYPPLKVDELGQAGHWVAWHMVLPVRGGSSNTNKAACLSHLANTVGRVLTANLSSERLSIVLPTQPHLRYPETCLTYCGCWERTGSSERAGNYRATFLAPVVGFPYFRVFTGGCVLSMWHGDMSNLEHLGLCPGTCFLV